MIIVAISIAFGIYLGIYRMIIDPVLEIARAIDDSTITAFMTAKAIIKVIFAFPVTIIISFLGTLFGIFITNKELINTDIDKV